MPQHDPPAPAAAFTPWSPAPAQPELTLLLQQLQLTSASSPPPPPPPYGSLAGISGSRAEISASSQAGLSLSVPPAQGASRMGRENHVRSISFSFHIPPRMLGAAQEQKPTPTPFPRIPPRPTREKEGGRVLLAPSPLAVKGSKPARSQDGSCLLFPPGRAVNRRKPQWAGDGPGVIFIPALCPS